MAGWVVGLAEVLTREGRRGEEYQEEEAGHPPHLEEGEGGVREEGRGTLVVQAEEDEELHLVECPAWTPGRLVEDSCMALEEVLSVGLALVRFLFPLVAVQECLLSDLHHPDLTAGEAVSWTETQTGGEPAWWRTLPLASAHEAPSWEDCP